MAQVRDDGQKHNHRILRLITRAMKQLNLMYLPRVKTEVFTLSDNYTIVLPEEASRPLKVGLMSDDLTSFMPFEIRGDLYTEAQLEGCTCKGDGTIVAAVRCPVHTLFNCNFGGLDYGCMSWSMPRIYAGRVNWNSRDNILSFETAGLDLGDMIAVQYETSEGDQCYTIPEILTETIIQRVLQWFAPNPREASYHQQQFRIELNEAKKTMETGKYEDLIFALCGRSMPTAYYSKGQKSTPVTEVSYNIVDPETTTKPGPYFDHDSAIANGVKPGEEYWLDSVNAWALPIGTVMMVPIE